MRILLATTLLLTLAGLALAGTASADHFGVGDCQKNGECAGGCVDVTTPCNRYLVCFGISYEVPFCVQPPPLTITGGPCNGIACVAFDPSTGCADVAVHLPPPFIQPVPQHACSLAWVTVTYGAQCFTVTVKVPPPLSQPKPIILCR
jgi:hypothetical protein